MASRFALPNLDPRMHREEDWTLSRQTTAQNGHAKANENALALDTQLTEALTIDDGNNAQRRRFVFTDPVAFRYLEEDPATVVLERHGRLKGYELYLVEQWACSRTHPTFVITTYTGDPNHSVLVGVLGVPADEDMWSPRLRVYVKAILQYHARPKDTPLGMLMVTNLSGFPSALTVIPVPDGDVKKHREDFIVNEDLKRLGCSGRSGLSLSAPAGATQAKFHQLYKTSDRIPLYSAVIELVKLCQVALIVFGKLEQEYADGLLCDVTERAINDWWTEIGSEYYNLEPSDGILGPTTVAALLGTLMGARNRLNYYGAPVAKDVFDIASLKRGISHFQKSQKLEKTRRLDRQTLLALHRVTAKAAAGEGWQVSKTVKSTVAELSSKGGEMVMGMVGGKEKEGIADVETLDIDRFVSLVHGARSKWLWYGKTRRTGTGETFGKSLPEMGNMVFSKDDQGGYLWSSKKSELLLGEDDYDSRKREAPLSPYSSRPPGSAVSMVDSSVEKDPQLRKAVLRSVQGKMGDARSGFERFRDGLGLRGHASRHSKDESMDADGSYFSPIAAYQGSGSALTPGVIPGTPKAFSWKNKPEEYMNGYRKDQHLNVKSVPLLEESDSNLAESKLILQISNDAQSEATLKDSEAAAKWIEQVKEIRRDLVTNEPSVVGSVYGGANLEGPLLEAERNPNSSVSLLHRRNSVSDQPTLRKFRDDTWWPRHLSFSEIEESVLVWEQIGALPPDGDDSDNGVALQRQVLMAEDSKRLYERISILRARIGGWAEKKVEDVNGLADQAAQDLEEVKTLHFQLNEAYRTVHQTNQDLLAEERSQLTEAIKDIEVLRAKLEYEINALVSKVEDVEDGVTQFESQVDELETRASELELELSHENWIHWAVRTITGIGTGPHMIVK